MNSTYLVLATRPAADGARLYALPKRLLSTHNIAKLWSSVNISLISLTEFSLWGWDWLLFNIQIKQLSKGKALLAHVIKEQQGSAVTAPVILYVEGICLIHDTAVNGENSLKEMSDHQYVKNYYAHNYVGVWQTRSQINNNSSAATILWTVVIKEVTPSSGRTSPPFTGLNTATSSSKSVLQAIYLNS